MFHGIRLFIINNLVTHFKYQYLKDYYSIIFWSLIENILLSCCVSGDLVLNTIIEITKIIDINNLFRNNYEEGINYIWNTP